MIYQPSDSTNELVRAITLNLFVSAGPKFYAFIICKPDGSITEVC